FNAREKRSLFSGGLGAAPYYEAEERDASQLMPLTVIPDWRACICMPLGDQSDLMGILVLTGAKKNAFGGRAISEILPVRSLATVALANHLRRAARENANGIPPEKEKVEPLTLDRGSRPRLEEAPNGTQAEVASAAPEPVERAESDMDADVAADAMPVGELRGQLEDLTR